MKIGNRQQAIGIRALAAACCLLPLFLAGCANGDVPVDWLALTEAEPAPAPSLPAECVSKDRAWTDVPDADVTRSQGAANLDRNKRAYKELIAKRRICTAALREQFPTAWAVSVNK